MFFYDFFCDIIKVTHYCIVLLFSYIKSLPFHLLDLCLFHMDIFLLNQLIVFFLSSFELKANLLISSVKSNVFISSVKTLSLSLLNICCVFNFFTVFYELNSLWPFLDNLCQFYFFLNNLFYYQVELLPSSFYNLQVKVFFLWHTFFLLFGFLSSLPSSIT